MVIVIHALKPMSSTRKFMSSQTDLLIFYTFTVLLVGEHFWGTWADCRGPTFTFLLDILGVKSIHQGRLRMCSCKSWQ